MRMRRMLVTTTMSVIIIMMITVNVFLITYFSKI